MATIYKKLKVNAPSDKVWRKVADVGGVHKLLGVITESHLEGDTRYCTTAQGGTLKERIVSIDNNLKRISYSITSSPFGFEYHASSWQVTADGDGSIVEWFTDVKPDTAAEGLGQLIESEGGNIVWMSTL